MDLISADLDLILGAVQTSFLKKKWWMNNSMSQQYHTDCSCMYELCVWFSYTLLLMCISLPLGMWCCCQHMPWWADRQIPAFFLLFFPSPFHCETLIVTSASIKAERKHASIMPVSRICHLKVNSSKLYVSHMAFNQIVTFDAWKTNKKA